MFLDFYFGEQGKMLPAPELSAHRSRRPARGLRPPGRPDRSLSTRHCVALDRRLYHTRRSATQTVAPDAAQRAPDVAEHSADARPSVWFRGFAADSEECGLEGRITGPG
eukprot:2310245-Rhodomonas_salina.3